MASSVDSETLLPVDVTSTFTTSTPVIYLTGNIKNATLDMVITVEWVYLGTDPETIITDYDLTVDEINMLFYFELSKPTNGSQREVMKHAFF